MDSESYASRSELALWEDSASWWTLEWLRKRGLKDHFIKLYRLGYDNERKAVVIPYLNALGDVRGVRWRLMDGNIKYMTPKGDGLHLFHVKASRKPNVWLCEGEFDAMVLDQLGLPTVAVPGVMSFKPEWRYLFAYAEHITIVMDGDEAGQKGAARLASLLGPLDAKVAIAKLPFGMDATDLYLKDPKQLLSTVRWEG